MDELINDFREVLNEQAELTEDMINSLDSLLTDYILNEDNSFNKRNYNRLMRVLNDYNECSNFNSLKPALDICYIKRNVEKRIENDTSCGSFIKGLNGHFKSSDIVTSLEYIKEKDDYELNTSLEKGLIANIIDAVIESAVSNPLTLNSALLQQKIAVENTIERLKNKGLEALIRSQKHIMLIHEAVKTELVKYGVNPDLIFPNVGSSRGEIKLSGFLKSKNQDIVILPNEGEKVEELIESGWDLGEMDEYGIGYTSTILSINVRSQLSSLAKNKDTLYERTFAEALNLHKRCPSIVMGEVYLIPTHEYKESDVKNGLISFSENATTINKYVAAFDAINQRNTTQTNDYEGEEYKYERICLLIVDFQQNPIKVYSTVEDLESDELLPENHGITNEMLSNLAFDNFVPALMQVYEDRFGTGKFI